MNKTIIAIMLLTTLLSSCAPATVESTETSTPLPAFTLTPTITLTPTLTLAPTITLTPRLPETLKITIDEKIPENIAALARTTVDQAYRFYVSLGCSPDFYRATFVGYESAGGEVGGIIVGWDDLTTISTNMDVRISHEMAHAMCELNFTNDPDTGTELMWLFEGIANYFADNERLIHTGSLSGVQGTVLNHQIGMSEWVIEKDLCNYPFQRVERDTGRLGVDFPDYPGVGEVAAALLANTSRDGTQSLINYYRHLVSDSSDVAFQKAFSKTKDEFYQLFTEECLNNFPSLRVVAPPFDMAVVLPPKPTQTLAAGFVRVQGNIILNDPSSRFTDYVINFCDPVTSDCLPGIPVQNDGTFTVDLKPGKYKIRVNSIHGSPPVGIYTKRGLVTDWFCGEIVRVYLNQELTLTIDFTPVACPT